MKSTFETMWLFFHRPIGLVELLILYACVQFYTHQASDYRLSSKTVLVTDHQIVWLDLISLSLGNKSKLNRLETDFTISRSGIMFCPLY